MEFGIKIEILGIAEGGEHSAEIGGNVLHDEGKCHVFFFAGGMEHDIAQGQEGEERHIIGNEHRAEKGNINQC